MGKNKIEKLLARLDNTKYHANAHSIDEYFALPIKDRERFGFWYKKPIALPGFIDEEIGGWTDFKKIIREKYPIQGWLREWCFDWDNPVYAFFSHTKHRISDRWYKTKCAFFPFHQQTRKAIPKTWADVTSLIVDVNFAMICEFYHDEVVDGHVDWQSDPHHQTFYKWLRDSVNYIEIERPALEQQLNKSFPKTPETRNLPYEIAYGEVHRIEELIKKTDTDILTKMINYRDMFWT